MSLNNIIKEKIKYEFELIEKELTIIDMINKLNDLSSLDDLQIRGIASSLHSIYNGVEKILIFIIKDKNVHLENNQKWHSALLYELKTHSILSSELVENPV